MQITGQSGGPAKSPVAAAAAATAAGLYRVDEDARSENRRVPSLTSCDVILTKLQ